MTVLYIANTDSNEWKSNAYCIECQVAHNSEVSFDNMMECKPSYEKALYYNIVHDGKSQDQSESTL